MRRVVVAVSAVAVLAACSSGFAAGGGFHRPGEFARWVARSAVSDAHVTCRPSRVAVIVCRGHTTNGDVPVRVRLRKVNGRTLRTDAWIAGIHQHFVTHPRGHGF